MRRQEWAIWAGAVALSLLIHFAMFVDSGSKAGAEKPSKQQTTRVSFLSVAAPVTPPQEAPVPPPKPKPKKKKKVKKKVPQVPLQEPVPQPEPLPPETPVVEKPSLPTQQASGTVEDPALLEQAKNEYMRRLMAHIESKKHYPKVARRRGIEGAVEVSFRLLPSGDISDVKIAQGHRILRKAVEEAMAAARPMPTPPPTLELPMSISFSVKFSLQSG
ncbi:MAG: TonB family protein [Pseudomonadota bacterium]